MVARAVSETAEDMRLTRLRQRVKASTGDRAPAWKPEPDDMVEGPLVRVDWSDGDDKKAPCRVATIHNVPTDADVSVFAGSVVLQRLFKKLQPQVGEYILLRYIGLADDGKTKLYDMVVDRDEVEPERVTWDAPDDGDAEGVPF